MALLFRFLVSLLLVISYSGTFFLVMTRMMLILQQA